MVALAVRYAGQPVVTCNARSLLHRAHTDLEAGKLIESGCRLREAVRVYLAAECEYWGCLPAKKKQRSPALLLKALKSCDDWKDACFEWLEEIIGYGNQLAHCEFVPASRIETCLSIVHCMLDNAPYLQQPAAAGRLS